MKYILSFFLYLSLSASAQESKQFTVEGVIKKKLTFSLESFTNLPIIQLDSATIYNHLMQPKSMIKRIRAVSLKEVLSDMEILAESPKLLSEYYLVCTATDGYKVVFSWNEVFNAETESNILILTNFETDPLKEQKGNIALFVPGDKATGRRFVKGLQKITVLRIN